MDCNLMMKHFLHANRNIYWCYACPTSERGREWCCFNHRRIESQPPVAHSHMLTSMAGVQALTKRAAGLLFSTGGWCSLHISSPTYRYAQSNSMSTDPLMSLLQLMKVKVRCDGAQA